LLLRDYEKSQSKTKGKDTVIVKEIKYRDKIKIEAPATEIKWKKYIVYKTDTLKFTDTLILTKPFIAKLEAIHKEDTLNIEFEFPENKFRFVLRPKPDTIKTIYITNIKEVEIEQTFFESYLEKPIYFGAGLILGYFVNDVTKGK